jgi:hypothetical protein
VSGRSKNRTPIASLTAFAIAAAEAISEIVVKAIDFNNAKPYSDFFID